MFLVKLKLNVNKIIKIIIRFLNSFICAQYKYLTNFWSAEVLNYYFINIILYLKQ